jgi:5-methyltetrahydropteroyltriglutamate--homocysteine methyltransferase
MLTSKDRILTTHCGSLPRPPQLSDLLLRQEAGESIDSEMLRRECADAVSRALQGQMQAGIDTANNPASVSRCTYRCG